jgi:DNA-binding NarL/FixJ family response regulator
LIRRTSYVLLRQASLAFRPNHQAVQFSVDRKPLTASLQIREAGQQERWGTIAESFWLIDAPAAGWFTRLTIPSNCMTYLDVADAGTEISFREGSARSFVGITRIAIIGGESSARKSWLETIDSIPGYSCVCTCSTAAEAFDELPRHSPEVVLIDASLPDRTGIECMARLVERMPKLEVIMLSGSKDAAAVFGAFKAGAAGILLKPFGEKELLAAIAEVRVGGAPMSAAIARMVVHSFRLPTACRKLEVLTARESEILTQLAEGLSNKEIATQLRIALGTVRNHVERIFKKLGVRCRTEAVAKYLGRNVGLDRSPVCEEVRPSRRAVDWEMGKRFAFGTASGIAAARKVA